MTVDDALSRPSNENRRRPRSGASGEAASRAQPQENITGRLRVVILDDEHPIRTLVRLLLKHADGFELAAEAASAAEAVDRVRKTQPEIVLVDLDVPVQDGREALPRIIDAAPEAMVLVMSGLNAADEAPTAFEQGAFAYVEKTRLGPGFGADLWALYRLFERWRLGENVWETGDASRVLR